MSKIKDRAKFVFNELEKLYPEPKTELENWKTEFQFLVCIMLSAQTTDIQVNKVTKNLFRNYPDVNSFASANVLDLEKLISSINFYKTKAKHLIEASKILKEEFKKKVPIQEKELLKLPGVGKKTANVFLNEIYQSNQGIAVDTHVSRVAQRLDLTKSTDPYKISLDLEKLFKQEEWFKINSIFVLFGRYNCKAQKPLCSNCPLNGVCKIGRPKKKTRKLKNRGSFLYTGFNKESF